MKFTKVDRDGADAPNTAAILSVFPGA